jgi:hypothetical protein
MKKGQAIEKRNENENRRKWRNGEEKSSEAAKIRRKKTARREAMASANGGEDNGGIETIESGEKKAKIAENGEGERKKETNINIEACVMAEMAPASGIMAKKAENISGRREIWRKRKAAAKVIWRRGENRSNGEAAYQRNR